jgi:hypothetical protein
MIGEIHLHTYIHYTNYISSSTRAESPLTVINATLLLIDYWALIFPYHSHVLMSIESISCDVAITVFTFDEIIHFR